MHHFEDLLHLPYRFGGVDPATGIDCRWTVRRGLERLFTDLRPEEFPLAPGEETAALAAAREGRSSWTLLGENVFSATREGDLLVGVREGGGGFVALLVDHERRAVLTATPDHGSCLLPIRKLLGVREVFRRHA